MYPSNSRNYKVDVHSAAPPAIVTIARRPAQFLSVFEQSVMRWVNFQRVVSNMVEQIVGLLVYNVPNPSRCFLAQPGSRTPLHQIKTGLYDISDSSHEPLGFFGPGFANFSASGLWWKGGAVTGP
jgi:hypothetical protein